MWQYMLTHGVGAKPLAHLMQYHLLQWEVAKVKPLVNSDMSLILECFFFVNKFFIWIDFMGFYDYLCEMK